MKFKKVRAFAKEDGGKFRKIKIGLYGESFTFIPF